MAPKNIDITKGNNKTQFISKLNEVYENELKAKIKKFGKVMPDCSKTVLSKKEISNLRNHPDLGLLNSKGRPISVNKVNEHFRWYNKQEGFRPDKSPLQISGVNPPKITGFTREYLESQKSLPREVHAWINRLDGKDWWNPRKKVVGPNGKVTLGGIEKGTGKKLWPPGLNRKNIWDQVRQSAEEVGAYNNKLFEELGFKFQKGHGWGVMGPANARTWVIPYAGTNVPRSEGHFTFRNVASQPQSPSFKQLTHRFWNAIIPNVPSKYSKHGVQFESAEDLRLAGGGGQGWRGTLEDILLSHIPDANIDDLDKLPFEQKAYVLFGDPGKGAGATAESRYFQIKNNQWDEVLETLAQGAETAEDLSSPIVKTGNIYDQMLKDPSQITGDLTQDIKRQINAIKLLPVDEQRLAMKKLADANNLSSNISKVKGLNPIVEKAVEFAGKVADTPIVKTGVNVIKKVDELVPTKVKVVGGLAISAVADPLDVIAGERQKRSEKGDTERSKYLKAAGALRSTSGQTGIGALISGTRHPLVTQALGLTSLLTTGASMRAQHLGETYKSDTEKVIDNLAPEPKHVEANTEDGVAEIKQYDPYEGISSL